MSLGAVIGLYCFEMIGRHLHHAAGAVGHEDVFVIVLLVGDHVDRPVARAELGDSAALHLGAGFQIAHRDGHQRRAGVGGDDVLLVLDRVRNESPDGRLRLITPVRPVIDLDARALPSRS